MFHANSQGAADTAACNFPGFEIPLFPKKWQKESEKGFIPDFSG